MKRGRPRKSDKLFVYDFYYTARNFAGVFVSGIVEDCSSREVAEEHLKSKRYSHVHVWLDEEEQSNGRRSKVAKAVDKILDREKYLSLQNNRLEQSRNS